MTENNYQLPPIADPNIQPVIINIKPKKPIEMELLINMGSITLRITDPTTIFKIKDIERTKHISLAQAFEEYKKTNPFKIVYKNWFSKFYYRYIS